MTYPHFESDASLVASMDFSVYHSLSIVSSILFHDPRVSSVAGGGETVTLQLASLLAASGHEVSILTRRAPHTKLFDDAIQTNPVVRVEEAPIAPDYDSCASDLDDVTRMLWISDRLAPESIRFNLTAAQFYREHSFDLVVVSFALDLVGLAARAPVLLNVFGLPPDSHAARLERHLLARCSHYTFASNYVRNEFSRLFELSPSLPLGPVVHASIHPAFYGPPSASRKDFDLCYAGRLVERKGIATAIEALSWLKTHRGSRVRMAIAGDGPQREALRSLADQTGVGSQITWMGSVPIEGVVDVLDRSSIFLYPTLLPEAFGCGNLEAMARGLTVITSNLGGTADYVTPEENALICDPRNPQSIASCIELALSDEASQASLRLNARSTALRFKQEIQAPCWLNCFQEILAHGRHP